MAATTPQELSTQDGGDLGDADTFQTDPSTSQAVLEQSKEWIMPWPLCLQLNKPDTRHTYTRRFTQWKVPGSLQCPSSRMSKCPSFLQISPSNRGEMLVVLKCCLICSAFTHNQKECTISIPSSRKKNSDGTDCGACHIPELQDGGPSTVRPIGVSMTRPKITAGANTTTGILAASQDQ